MNHYAPVLVPNIGKHVAHVHHRVQQGERIGHAIDRNGIHELSKLRIVLKVF